MKPLLRLQQVHTHIGPYHILQGVDIEVAAGEATALLGRNGVGKTTTLRTIMGLNPPTGGSVEMEGMPLQGLAPFKIAACGIGYVPEAMGIFADLTVSENMELAARGRAAPEPQRLERIHELFPPLLQFWRKPAGLLSGGQKQMLALARSLALPQRLLLLDEPTKGLAPAIVASFAAVLASALDEGAGILLVEQNFAFASQVSAHSAVMDDGRIVHAGPMEELAGDKEKVSALLGLQGPAADGALAQ